MLGSFLLLFHYFINYDYSKTKNQNLQIFRLDRQKPDEWSVNNLNTSFLVDIIGPMILKFY